MSAETVAPWRVLVLEPNGPDTASAPTVASASALGIPPSRPLDAERRFALVEGLLEKGYAVTRPGSGGPVAPVDRAELVVVHEPLEPGSAPRGSAVGRVAGSNDASEEFAVRLVDISGASPAEAVGQVDALRAEVGRPQPGAWKPWFPVIDYQRCTNCMQCLSFCLFDVYGVDAAGEIEVRNEDKCKTNCPACSRVCPEVAILFPKYGQGPINGAEVNTEDLEREKMKIDVSALLGGDIYSLLRQRHERAASRFSKERDAEKALKERQRCLKRLQEDMAEIPPEVLFALPSADEIRSKAAEALEKTKAAKELRDRLANDRGESAGEGPD